MRADRLVAILLLLQRRERVTAAEVAAELEISERTARRDLEALAIAGLPVYSERGRHGGWRLLGGARTDLSGLNAAEARALFLVAGPSAHASPQLRAALRKLLRALPEPFRMSAETAAGSVVHDPAGWSRMSPLRPQQPEHLDALQAAIADGEQVRLGYRDRQGNETVRVVHPLGTALKSTVWYLLAGTDAGLRTFRIGRVTSVQRTDEPLRRPPDFDLEAAWRDVVDRVDQMWTPVEVTLRTELPMVRVLRWVFPRRTAAGEPDAAGCVEVKVRGESTEMLAVQLAGFGARVEVVRPPEVRQRLAEIGRELTSRYAG